MKKYLVIFLLALTFAFSGCARSDKETSAQKETTSVLEMLSKEQLDYLTEKLMFTEDAIAYMDYESVNWNLLGTGLELYNPSSGVEINGLDYIPEENIDFETLKPESDRKITYEELYAIRLKEKNMRVEYFLEYYFGCVKESDNKFIIKLPLEGYDDTYAVFGVTVSGEKLHMSVPRIYYSRSMSLESAILGGSVFSILYDSYDFKAFFKDNKKQFDEVILGIQYSSVTPKSMVLTVINYTDKNFKCNKSFEIYKGEGGEKELLKDYSVKTKENFKLDAHTSSRIDIAFGSDKDLEPGIYTIILDGGVFEDRFEVK